MKIKDGFILKKLRGIDGVVVPVGSRAHDGMATLNETGVFLWEALQNGADSESSLVDALVSEYEVDAAAAEKDVRAFIDKAISAGLITK